jgi:GNAT superfamily N-acetyltransferase
MTAFVVRPAQPDEAVAIARVHVASWQTTYRGLLPDSYIAEHTLERRARFWHKLLRREDRVSLVAEVQGKVVGLAVTGPTATPSLGCPGELYALYLLKAQQGRGLGRALFEASLAGLEAHGFSPMMLWVLADNPARRFYEHIGGTQIAERIETFAGIPLREVAFRCRRGPRLV